MNIAIYPSAVCIRIIFRLSIGFMGSCGFDIVWLFVCLFILGHYVLNVGGKLDVWGWFVIVSFFACLIVCM